VSAGIKKMLAERAERERSDNAVSNRFSEGVARIKAAAPSLDAGFASATKWKPSEALLIGYCVLATGAHPENAEELLRDRLGQ
jgi:hypothetical protein